MSFTQLALAMLFLSQGNHYFCFYGFRVYYYNKDQINYEKSQPFEWFRLQMIWKCRCKTIIYYRIIIDDQFQDLSTSKWALRGNWNKLKWNTSLACLTNIQADKFKFAFILCKPWCLINWLHMNINSGLTVLITVYVKKAHFPTFPKYLLSFINSLIINNIKVLLPHVYMTLTDFVCFVYALFGILGQKRF